MTEKRPGPTPDELEAARDKRLRDVIGPGTRVLLVGINPSLYSAAVGHHFARPGNRFWKALHASGATDRVLDPSEDRLLPRYGLGVTNLAPRATARADELSRAELQRGAKSLARKVVKHGLRGVAFLGVTAYRAAFDRPHAGVGAVEPQTAPLALARVRLWILPNPSGLNAHYQLPDLARLFRAMRADLLGDAPDRAAPPDAPD